MKESITYYPQDLYKVLSSYNLNIKDKKIEEEQYYSKAQKMFNELISLYLVKVMTNIRGRIDDLETFVKLLFITKRLQHINRVSHLNMSFIRHKYGAYSDDGWRVFHKLMLNDKISCQYYGNQSMNIQITPDGKKIIDSFSDIIEANKPTFKIIDELVLYEDIHRHEMVSNLVSDLDCAYIDDDEEIKIDKIRNIKPIKKLVFFDNNIEPPKKITDGAVASFYTMLDPVIYKGIKSALLDFRIREE